MINTRTDDLTTEKEERRIYSTSCFRLNENEEAGIVKVSAVTADVCFKRELLIDKGIELVNANIGMWQEIVFCFSGMVSALHTDALTFNTCIPEEIKTISYKDNVGGQLVQGFGYSK